MPQVAIAQSFFDAYYNLPKNVQSKIGEVLSKFKQNPRHPGIHYEKLNHIADDHIKSIRINQEYRGIVAEQDDTYLLLWVDHHDEAYDWAKRKKCTVNDVTGAIQLYDVMIVEEQIVSNVSPGLFSDILDEDLLKIGVPFVVIPFIKQIATEKEFYDAKDHLSIDVVENLSYILEGIPIDEIIEMVSTETVSTTFAEALDNNNSKQSFYVVEGEEDLQRMLDAPAEKWRVYLHPMQREVVERNFSGPARVTGGAGTGKTVVAMHRAKQLASKMKPGERILFTTFTVNLAQDIKDNLGKICTFEELNRIEVTNLDAWISDYLRRSGSGLKIEYDDEKINKLWYAAIDISGISEFPLEFCKDEWKYVVSDKDAFEVEKYVRVSRTGRGERLDRRERLRIWKIFEAYMNLMDERGVCDSIYGSYICKESITESGGIYTSIIVDEGQDLSSGQYRLLSTIIEFFVHMNMCYNGAFCKNSHQSNFNISYYKRNTHYLLCF